MAQAILNSIHHVFPPPFVTGTPLPDPISIGKMIARGFWDTVKEILGWQFDGVSRTLTLTDKKFTKLTNEPNDLLTFNKAVANTMADMASKEHSTDPTTFLTQFTAEFPPRQKSFWHLCLPHSSLVNAFSLLQTELPIMALWHQPLPNKNTFDALGNSSSYKYIQTSMHFFQTSHTNNVSICFNASPPTAEMETTTQAIRGSGVRQSRWHYKPLLLPLFWMDNQILWSRRKYIIIYPLDGN